MSGRVYAKVFYSLLDTLDLMDDAEAGRLFKAVLAYGRDGEERRLSGSEKLIFSMLRVQLDLDRENYDAISRVRSECGKMGGRPKKAIALSEKQMVSEKTNCIEDKDKDKDKDKDQDKDKDKDEDKPPVRDAVVAYATENLMPMSYGNLEELVSFKNDLPDDVIMYAIDTACGNGKRVWSYVRKILARWCDEGIRTVGQVKEEESRWAAQSVKGADGKRVINPALDYQRGGIDMETLNNLGKDFWKEDGI